MAIGTEDSGSPSLADFIGSSFGDIVARDDSPESPSSAPAGAPPPESAPEISPTSDAPEGAETDAERAEPSADAADAPLDDTGVPSPDADPLADAKPATYVVDGQQRTYDGIKVLGDDGAVIEAKDLPDVLRRLGERDHLFEANQAQYRAQQQLESLTEWKTIAEDGTEQTVRGQEGLVEMQVEFARLRTVVEVMDSILGDAAKFAELVAIDPATESIVVNPKALEYLQKDVALAAGRADQATRAQLASRITEAEKPAAQPADYTNSAPKAIEWAAGDAHTHLTPQDREFLTSQINRYVRDTTSEERRANPSQLKIIDASYTQLVKRTADLRAEQAKTGAVVSNAAKDNAARLAAAVQGKKPASSQPRVTPPTPDDTRSSDAESAWDLQEKAAAAALRRRSA